MFHVLPGGGQLRVLDVELAHVVELLQYRRDFLQRLVHFVHAEDERLTIIILSFLLTFLLSMGNRKLTTIDEVR